MQDIFKKKSDHKNDKKIMIILSLFCLVVWLFIVGFVMKNGFKSDLSQSTFDQIQKRMLLAQTDPNKMKMNDMQKIALFNQVKGNKINSYNLTDEEVKQIVSTLNKNK